MRAKIAIILFIPAIFLVFAAAFVLAQGTGSISGKILDSQTQQPLVGASVFLVGTNRGANTDLNGKFTIKRVPPGTYSLRITQIGYTELVVKGVEVKVDLNYELNTSLTPAQEQLGEKITVQVESDIIEKFEVSGKSTITKETIEKTPVQTVDELIGKVSGVVNNNTGEVFIRGGRAFEVGYIVDGVPIDDPIGGLAQAPVPDALNRQPRCEPEPRRKDKPNTQQSILVPRCPPYYPVSPYGQNFEDMQFEDYGTNPFVLTSDDYQSTFAIDIDDASYSLTRTYLENSQLPPNDAVRVEEFINHFDYNYQAPRENTFSINIEGAPSRFGQNSRLVRIGIKGKEIDVEERKPTNITFVVDVSGSMNERNKYTLVMDALRHVIDHCYASDIITIVAYNQSAQLILKPTSVRYKDKILAALDKLYPRGSTNVQAGLHLGYELASRYFGRNKNNCLILFSDGVANVGQVDADNLLKETKRYADDGITLSTIGVGMGNYNDVLLEKLGDKGNGFYAYCDDMQQVRQVFDGNLSGALQVIARDVKIQVEFDPEVVYSYRLLGYENRDVADYNFRNDRVDGGEIGPGHAVTALYEVYLNRPYNASKANGIGRVFVRYKNPESNSVEEVSCSIDDNIFRRSFKHGTTDFQLAACAAEFSEIMRDSYWARYSNLNSVLKLANEIYYQTEDSDVLELVQLITKARDLRNLDSDYFSKE